LLPRSCTRIEIRSSLVQLAHSFFSGVSRFGIFSDMVGCHAEGSVMKSLQPCEGG
jgi:hypothetical protein